MSRLTSVDDSEVEPTLAGLARVAQALADGADALGSVMAATHGCWGDDQMGKKFAGSYEPAAAKALEAAEQLAATVAKIRSRLAEGVATLKDTDADGGRSLDSASAGEAPSLSLGGRR